jgi:tol-pal system protein YbgF
MRRVGLVLLTALSLPAWHARAGIFDDDEARLRIEKLRTDVTAMAQRLDLAARNQIEFANQAEALKAEVARLRGQLEVLLNDMETTQKRQRDFYVDLDGRLRKLETAAPTNPPAGDAKPDAAKVDPAQETREYEAALGAFKAAKYKEANAAFLAFVNAHPNSSLAASAWYWAASSHYQLKEYAKAAETFGKVAAGWPNDPKAPDALLAEGNALAEAGNAKGANAVFQKLVATYPASSAAQSAKVRLKKK